jgi:nicotinamide phosphoribosyltransferase
MGDEAVTLAGCGHLSQFKGSDSLPAARMMQEVYDEVTGFSVPATEHSVMCAGGEENELETYERILDTYPTGIVSIVSDTWDYFDVLRNTLNTLKPRIMERDGKVVIRPDSGDPVKIICGNDKADGDEYLGSLEVLGEVFGYTEDSTGLKLLDPHIGLIYGDGMNQEIIFKMLSTMVSKGWSPLNIVFGIGAYTYQYMTRDELGFAFKGTAVKRDGEWIDIQKNPKTDSHKKSLTGWIDIQKNPKTDSHKKSLTGRFVGGDLERIY